MVRDMEKEQGGGGRNRSPEEIRAARSARKRKRYAEDPEYRKREQAHARRHHATHREEIAARRRHRYATDPEYRAKYLAATAKSARANLLKRHGMSLREYELRLALQGGACAICRKTPKVPLCIDHCHVTGKVRGLLCRKCNSALGFYDDDPEVAQAGADYLRAFYDSLEPRGDVMTSTDEQSETGRAGRLMRTAILLELECEPGKADDGATGKLRLIARRLVDKAVEGDIQAIKEVLDRIDGKSVPGPGDAARGSRQASVRWKSSTSPPTTGAAAN
jgi:Recombination endonuclease VII